MNNCRPRADKQLKDPARNRVAVVENCAQCPFGSIDRGGVYCTRAGKLSNSYEDAAGPSEEFSFAASPPEWCPLPLENAEGEKTCP